VLPVIIHPTITTTYSLTLQVHLTLFTPSNGYVSLLALSRIFLNYTSSAREINNPVVLVHGFGDVPGLSGSWKIVEEVLREEAGVPKSDILTLQMPPLESIQERTRSAIRDITAKFAGRNVHLIAHSMVR
jgi:pimeloyl-ACP methyl ester carboxylesterase